MDKYSLINNKFEITETKIPEKLHIQLKKTQFEQDGQISTMIQVFDVTNEVLYNN